MMAGHRLAYSPEESLCVQCGKKFMSNFYSHENRCRHCKNKEEFLKNPIKFILKKIIEWISN